MTLNESLKCGGYTKEKLSIVNQYQIDWKKMPLYCWVGDWLCTHAGLSQNFLKSNNLERLALNDILDLATDSLKTIDDCGDDNIFLQAGETRGGDFEYGGIVWCDYSEFVDLHNVKQIFGHTPNPKVRRVKNGITEHICLDTSGKNYAIYNDKTDTMTVMRV